MSSVAQLPRIRRLSTETACQIAAGEVVERPASVVKELVENALDAGADSIVVEIDGDGSPLIRVCDDGQGIYPDDMGLALQAQATSKLRSIADLDCIVSLGFRGEALSSIAAVADVCIVSACAEGQAYRVCNQDSVPQPVAHPCGTTVEVRKLFHRVPARRKFLKSEKTEFLRISQLIRAFALGHCKVRFRLLHNGRQVFHCPQSTTSSEARVDAVLGKKFRETGFVVQGEAAGMRFSGWVGSPDAARGQSDRQYSFVNGRLVKDRLITHAVRMAVEDMIPSGRYISYLLYLEMDPALVDVNMHPSKRELKFHHARELHDLLYEVLLNTLHQRTLLPGVSHTEVRPQTGGKPWVGDTGGSGLRPREYRQILESAASTLGTDQVVRTDEPEAGVADTSAPLFPEQHFVSYARGVDNGVVIQLPDCQFALVQWDSVAVLADIPATNVWLAQRTLREQMRASEVSMRPLAVPVSLPMRAEQVRQAEAQAQNLRLAGIAVEPQGLELLAVRGLPACLALADPVSLLEDVLKLLAEPDTEKHIERLCECLAAHANDSLPESLTEEMLARFAGEIRRFSDLAPTQVPWRTLYPADWPRFLRQGR